MNTLALLTTVATITFAALRAFQRPELQAKLADTVQWSRWSLGAQLATVFGVSLTTTLLGVFIAKGSVLAALPEAISTALVAALAAMGLHKGTKDLGSLLTAPDREPSSIRTMIDPLLPVDHDKAGK